MLPQRGGNVPVASQQNTRRQPHLNATHVAAQGLKPREALARADAF
jgi:hypothetical protein